MVDSLNLSSLGGHLGRPFLFGHLRRNQALDSPPTYLAMQTSEEDLRASIERHNTAFESLLRLIPAKYYIVNDDPEARPIDSRLVSISE
jgi:hypothetical protein